MSGEVGYAGVHYRLRRERGPAREYLCSCGRQADEWAYDDRDPQELRDQKGRPYSLDLDHYQAKCLPCHRRFDAGEAQCRNGHPWTEETAYVYRGQRMCRECRRIYSNRYYHQVVKQRKKESTA